MCCLLISFNNIAALCFIVPREYLALLIIFCIRYSEILGGNKNPCRSALVARNNLIACLFASIISSTIGYFIYIITTIRIIYKNNFSANKLYMLSYISYL